MIEFETETKILEKKHEDFHSLILSLGGEVTPPQLILTQVYKHPDRDDYVRFREIRESVGNVGFVRYENIRMTIKKSVEIETDTEPEFITDKTYREDTQKVDDRMMEHFSNALAALGVPRRCSTKIRYKYLLDNCVLDFDRELEVDIPEFLEIEGSPEQIRSVVSKLGINSLETTGFTSDDLYKHYGVSLPSDFFVDPPDYP